jgi:hypothetical protein
MNGARPRPATGRARCLALTAAVALAVVAPVILAPGTAHAQEGTDAPTAGDPGVRLGFQSSTVAPDGDFTVLLDVTDAPAGSELVVNIYDRIGDADDLQASVDEDPNDILATFDPIPLAAEAAPDSQDAAFTINLYARGGEQPPGAWAYRLDEAGAYPVEIRLRDGDGEVLSSTFTYLVRRPAADEDVTATRVAVHTTIRQDPTTDPVAATDPQRGADPELVEALAPILTAFADHPGLPASFTVGPATADRLAADARAGSVLARLRTELGREDRQLLGAPFVDLDVASLVANGLTDEITRQAALGTQALTATLGRPTRRTWAIDRRIDEASASALADLGVDRLVLPDHAVAGGERRTPVAIGGSAVAAHALTDSSTFALEADPDDPVLAANQLLGRLAAVATTSQGPTGIVLDVDAATTDPDELQVVLDGLATLNPYLRAATVDEVFDEVPTAADEAALVPPTASGLGDYPERSASAHQLVASYRSMVKDRPELVEAFRRPLALSAAAGLPVATRRAILARIDAQIRDRLATITVPAEDTITLGARDARFPLPVASGLDYPVQVVIQLESSERLSFPNDRIQATLDGERTLVPVRLRTLAPGNTPLEITVRSPDGQVVLAESRYTVRSTAVSGVGILLTIGAAAFLALWWGRHWVRHRRRARHARPRPRPGRGRGAPPDPAAPVDDGPDLDDDIADDVLAPAGRAAPAGDATPTGDPSDVTASSDPGSNPG